MTLPPAGHHAVGIQDALRQAGRARGEQDLGDGVAGQCCGSLGEPVSRRLDGERAEGDRLRCTVDADPRRCGQFWNGAPCRELRAALHEHEARLQHLGDVLQARQPARHHRVVRRHRRHNHADRYCGERHDSMLDRVAGQNRQPVAGRGAQVDQALADRLYLQPGFAVADLVPPACLVALREKDAVRSRAGPVRKKIGDPPFARTPCDRRAQNQRSIGPSVDRQLPRRKCQLMCRH